MPIDEALPIAKQIADALEAAHEQGVVHRDLKPANVKLRSDGVVKVLDFGLAKIIEDVGRVLPSGPAGAAGSTEQDPAYVPSQAPTMTSPAMTRMGVILGTATYMAPEQARGRVVDKRADIWAFGCVLFEMLTGMRAFDGEDVAETLGAVIHKEPAWSALPADTPPYLRTLLRRWLQKDPKKRLPHIGIARIEIDEGPATEGLVATPVGATQPPRGLWSNARLAWRVAGVSVATAVALAVTVAMSLPREAVDTGVARATILLPPGVAWPSRFPGTASRCRQTA